MLRRFSFIFAVMTGVDGDWSDSNVDMATQPSQQDPMDSNMAIIIPYKEEEIDIEAQQRSGLSVRRSMDVMEQRTESRELCRRKM
jgi:hypothetical protein